MNNTLIQNNIMLDTDNLIITYIHILLFFVVFINRIVMNHNHNYYLIVSILYYFYRDNMIRKNYITYNTTLYNYTDIYI